MKYLVIHREQVTLNLENFKIRPLTEKHIRKQLLLV